jgi:hypothetical protein
VIFPLLTVIDTCTSPYWVLTAGPVKVPDFPAGALVLGADVGCLLGAGAVECVATGVVAVVFLGADGFGVLFFAGDLDVDALADGELIGDAATVGVTGAVLATAMPATWVLYENSAARPAAVVPRTTTARRMKPPLRY